MCRNQPDHRFLCMNTGDLFGKNAKHVDYSKLGITSVFKDGDRVGVLLNEEKCSLQFFKNGAKYGLEHKAMMGEKEFRRADLVHGVQMQGVGCRRPLQPPLKAEVCPGHRQQRTLSSPGTHLSRYWWKVATGN